jgi:hypothetical protein
MGNCGSQSISMGVFTSLFPKRMHTAVFLGLVTSGLAICLSISGCGYSLQGRVKPTFRPAKGIFVTVFNNQSDEVGAELVFTNALVRELESRGEVVVTDRQPGAMEFRGVVSSISYSPTTFIGAGALGLRSYRQLPSEVVVQASIQVELVNPQAKQVVWSGTFSSFRRVPMPLDRTFNYQVPSANGLITQSFIQGQFPAIARDISRDIYDSMLWEEG